MSVRITHALHIVAVALALCVGDAMPVASAQDKPRKEPTGAARRSRTPHCTSVVRFPAPVDASAKLGQPALPAPSPRVQLRYRAVPLSTKTLASVTENARARAFYNGRVFRRLIELHTDLPLEIGGTQLAAGRYDAGLHCERVGKWRFVVIDRAGRTIASTPLALTGAETPIPCLNLSLIPIGESALAIAVRYGTRRGTVFAKLVVPKS